MSAVDVKVLDELGELIEDLTTTGKPSLDEKQIKRVKNICKTSNSYVNHAYHILITQLKKKHSEIRLSCFQIIQELFSRSHVFRELVLGEFQVFMELVIGTDSNVPLPPPLKTARTLREKAVEAVENWHQKYGSHYKKLDLGYHYLKRIKHVEFDALRTRSLAERRQAEEREQRRQRILQKKVDKVENEIAEQTGHIDLCLTEVNNCFKLLLPPPDDYEVHCLELEKKDSSPKPTSSNDLNTEEPENGKEEESTNVAPSSSNTNDDNKCNSTDQDNNENQSGDLMKDHGLGSRSYEINLEVNKFQPSVDETEDNSIIIKTAREMNKEITHKYLPMVSQWLQVFSKAGHSHQRILSIIDMKRQLQSAKDKFNELNISPIKLENNQKVNKGCDDDDDENDEDEEEFLDVPEKEGIEYIPESKMAEYGLESVLQNSSSANATSSEDSRKDDESFLKQYGFSLKDSEDPTSHARAILEARKKLKFTDSKLDNQAAMSTSTSQKQALQRSLKVESDSEKRNKLLEKAPVVPFDMDLYHWEDPNYDPPKIIRSDNFNNYWASNDMEAEQLFEEDRGSMLNRRIAFGGKFEPVKWACRAPLPNGNLCPRKDRVKCPFHGVIVARDEKGNPVGERSIDMSAPSTSTSQATSSQATSTTTTEDWRDLQRDIEAATGLDLGKNVKKRKAHKRKIDTSEKELSRKQKYSRLTDIHRSTKTPRSRLERKVLSKESIKRVAEEMDNLATKKFLDKFGDQFNYQLRK